MYTKKYRDMSNFFLLLTMVLALVGSGMAQPMSIEKGQVVRNVRYPDYDKHGQLNFEVMGDEAEIQPDGLIQIKNLKLIFYNKGKPVVQVTTPWCLFDRVKRTAVSKSEVCIARKEIVLTGRGFEWKLDGEQFKIHNDVKMVLRND